MAALPRILALGAVLLGLPGCATMAMNAAMRAAHPEPAWNGEVALASEPPGAQCVAGSCERQPLGVGRGVVQCLA